MRQMFTRNLFGIAFFWTYLIDRNFASEGIEKLYQVLQENFPLGAIDDNSC